MQEENRNLRKRIWTAWTALLNLISEKLEAPLVFGHPTTDASAYGWVESLKREGEKLFAYN